jgi:hypothetical protein
MMPPDQLRSPTAIKFVLRPLELMVAEHSLKSAGGVDTLRRRGLRDTFCPRSSGLKAGFIVKFSMDGGG